MNWLTLTVISAVTYAVAEIVGKYVSDEKSEPVYIGIIAAFFTAITSFIFVLFEPLKLPSNPLVYAGLISSAAVVAIGIVTYYEGLKNSDISEFSLLSRSRILFIVIGGIFFFSERFTLAQGIGGALILLSVFFLTWEGKKFSFGVGARYALITAILFGIGSLLDKAVISSFSALLYTFLIYFFTVLFMLPFALVRYKKNVVLPTKETVGKLFIAGSLYGVSAYAIYSAYIINGPIVLVTLASQLEIPITILWGIFMLKENKRALSKLASMALLIIGIILLK